MNAKTLCRRPSGGTHGQGQASIVAPPASYAVGLSQHTGKPLAPAAADRSTAKHLKEIHEGEKISITNCQARNPLIPLFKKPVPPLCLPEIQKLVFSEYIASGAHGIQRNHRSSIDPGLQPLGDMRTGQAMHSGNSAARSVHPAS